MKSVDMPKAARPPAVILAGGKSSRMGSDKAAVMLGGKPLLLRAIERLSHQVSALAVNSNTLSTVDFATAIPVCADTVPGHAGPWLAFCRQCVMLQDAIGQRPMWRPSRPTARSSRAISLPASLRR